MRNCDIKCKIEIQITIAAAGGNPNRSPCKMLSISQMREPQKIS